MRKKKEERFSDLKHLSADNWFTCCVKLYDPTVALIPYSKYGVVFNSDKTVIHVRSLRDEFTGEVIKFASVEEMLQAGWLVD